MTTAKYVANFFIELANDDEYGDGMTNMRLNKLLYFAQGHYLRELATRSLMTISKRGSMVQLFLASTNGIKVMANIPLASLLT